MSYEKITRGKPWLRISRRPEGTWLSVQQNVDGLVKTLGSYGSATNPKNWDRAIEKLLEEWAKHLQVVKEKYFDGVELDDMF